MKSRVPLLIAGCAALLLPGCAPGPAASRSAAIPDGPLTASRPLSSLQSGAMTAGPLKGEVFSATDVQLTRHRRCRAPIPTNVTFTASGSATGPYPGTFTMMGQWYSLVDDDFLLFGLSETFTITAGRQTVNGTVAYEGQGSGGPTQLPWIRCHRFGPAGRKFQMQYSVSSNSGIMGTRAIEDGQLHQTFF